MISEEKKDEEENTPLNVNIQTTNFIDTREGKCLTVFSILFTLGTFIYIIIVAHRE